MVDKVPTGFIRSIVLVLFGDSRTICPSGKTLTKRGSRNVCGKWLDEAAHLHIDSRPRRVKIKQIEANRFYIFIHMHVHGGISSSPDILPFFFSRVDITFLFVCFTKVTGLLRRASVCLRFVRLLLWPALRVWTRSWNTTLSLHTSHCETGEQSLLVLQDLTSRYGIFQMELFFHFLPPDSSCPSIQLANYNYNVSSTVLYSTKSNDESVGK